MNQSGVKIAAVGHYAPDEILSNADLEKILDTSDEWIISRTGMQRRHVSAAHQATSDLAVAAAHKAFAHTSLKPQDIDCYIVATVT
ncbi:MAG: 3-oxoacyl-ACP synthase, partial [Rhodanobacteraceae bacterium]